MTTVPETRRDETVDVLHGESVPDPYRWLEDAGSAETAAWVAAQNRATDAYLDTLPNRAELRVQLTEMEKRTRYGVPVRRGDRWFWTRHEALADQPVVVVADDVDDEGQVLLDPASLSTDGTVTISSWSVSDDGSQVVYATSASGSDWMTWRVRSVDTGEDLPDVVEWSKFCEAAWLPDGSGFFYCSFDPPADDATTYTAVTTQQRLSLHRLGAPVADDVVVRVDPDPQRQPRGEVTHDGRWLVVTTDRGTDPESSIYVVDLAHDGWELRPLLPEPAQAARVIGSEGTTFYVLTDAGAPLARIVAVDLDQPEPEHWRTVVPESEDRLLDAVAAGPGQLLAVSLHDASSRLQLWGTDGSAGTVLDVPGPVSVEETLSGSPDQPTVQFGTMSFTDSGTVWQHDLASATTRALRSSGGVDGVVVERVRATSEDGTAVPVFLVRRSDLAHDGQAQVLLYGYGGFDIPLTPTFNPGWATWVARGGLLAVANLRGGGEFGRPWYDAGRLAHKQNVFDDFAGCARWLVESGWSTPGKISAHGGSNGGLLVGALLTQHPELIGAAVPRVGVLDMLRYHRFTIGWAWTSDYGDPDDPEGYRWVRAYSPLHRISTGTAYPATLVTTGDHDDRVVPAHSFKFAATLQAAQGAAAPVLIRIDTSAGHGAGKPVSKRIAENADVLAFCEAVLR